MRVLAHPIGRRPWWCAKILILFYLWCRPANFKIYTKYFCRFGVFVKKLGFVETQLFTKNDSDIGVNIRKDISDKFGTQLVCNIELDILQTPHLRSIFHTSRRRAFGGSKSCHWATDGGSHRPRGF